ncbi:transcriptional regulator QRICH1-like [Mytilus californianus]|uniref:transcriptional regulator QRICH1-like n=1 Tax=Mytilus californianus TaxID=6549 RepID=UPI0022466141|nr:transcriptional regulator QRICH1-like [Mytilus californianus]
MALEINNDPHIGVRVKLVGGNKGIILRKTINFDFPLWDIKLDSGKLITEARYRFDILEDSVQNIEPEITTTHTITKQKLPTLVPAIDPCPTDEFSDDNVMYFAEPIHVSNRDSTFPKQSSKTQKRQFVTIPEDSIDTFVLDQENKNTARKTQSDIQSLQQFLVTKLETREIYSIPPHELNQILCQFLISVRKDDGDQYEPASLKGMLCSFDRYLRQHNYGYQISKSAEFSKVKDVLTAKQVELKKMGKGNGNKKAETLCDQDIEKLFQSGEIGVDYPTTLLHTVWFFNTVYFGLRGVTEHHQMTWGDVKIQRDNSSGLEYLQMNERNTKTRTGKSLRDQRDIPQMAWANPENELKCPVHAYKLYRSKRPLKFSNPTDPFYIQENTNREKSGLWYKSQPIGINKLGKFMKKMATAAGKFLCIHVLKLVV